MIRVALHGAQSVGQPATGASLWAIGHPTVRASHERPAQLALGVRAGPQTGRQCHPIARTRHGGGPAGAAGRERRLGVGGAVAARRAFEDPPRNRV